MNELKHGIERFVKKVLCEESFLANAQLGDVVLEMACILYEGVGVYINNKGHLEICDCEEKEEKQMYCYDENGKFLGVVSCFPKEGEEHMWGDDVYICTSEFTTEFGCRNGLIFKKI